MFRDCYTTKTYYSIWNKPFKGFDELFLWHIIRFQWRLPSEGFSQHFERNFFRLNIMIFLFPLQFSWCVKLKLSKIFLSLYFKLGRKMMAALDREMWFDKCNFLANVFFSYYLNTTFLISSHYTRQIVSVFRSLNSQT